VAGFRNQFMALNSGVMTAHRPTSETEFDHSPREWLARRHLQPRASRPPPRPFGLPSEGICQRPPALPFGSPAASYLTPFGSLRSIPRGCAFPKVRAGRAATLGTRTTRKAKYFLRTAR